MERREEAHRSLLRTNEEDEKSELRKVVIEEFGSESKKLWHLAAPVVIAGVFRYAFWALTLTFAGSVDDLDLEVITVANSLTSNLSLGLMIGMGSALETLCGQAFGAGNLKMMGVYLQRSWVILLTMACLIIPIYAFVSQILLLCGQTVEISQAGGTYALWMIPQLFAYAIFFPAEKFLQQQAKVIPIACVSFTVLLVHVFLSWLLLLKFRWGLAGAAIVLNTSWCLLAIGLLLYIVVTKSDGAWTGFTWLAFTDLWDFVKLSMASAVMICFDSWFISVLVLVVGRLPDPLVPVDALGISLGILGWHGVITGGFCAATSVRVSNELGAGNHRQAMIATRVVSVISMTIALVVFVLVLATRESFPYFFTQSQAVAEQTTKISILLALTSLLNGLQPVLSGVVVGAGWQSLFGYINVGCYYLVGLPAGIILGFTFKLGVMGVWGGMIGGALLQTIVLIIVTSLANWKKEADKAESKLQKWGGSIKYVE